MLGSCPFYQVSPPPVLISNPYVPGSVEHAIRAVRISGDSCTDKIYTDVFFEQAGSGPSGNDHCISEIRTAGAGAGVVGDEVSPQQPLPPAGVGNRPEDKPKTEPVSKGWRGKGMFNQHSFDQCLRPLQRPNHPTWTSSK